MNSFGYKGWNILHYIHIAISVLKKTNLLCTSESISVLGICNVEKDTFSTVMIQAYKLRFMNWCFGVFFLFCLEKMKDRMFWKNGFLFFLT